MKESSTPEEYPLSSLADASNASAKGSSDTELAMLEEKVQAGMSVLRKLLLLGYKYIVRASWK